ncbi:RHS repeat domain-containing protein [Aliikangiella sp. IMCC44359]|uniref:RHS repeat domain-containing protein n=1 Tax=Aliikangiella sp. IMCC44359 TaxID=3459125 RepID=UPI00403B1562
MRIRKLMNVSIGLSLLTTVASLVAAPDDPPEDFDQAVDKNILERLNVSEDITPHTVDLLGERIDMNSGSISFHQTDITIPGNSSLDVSIKRVFRGARFFDMNKGEMGDWQLDIPHIHTTLFLKLTTQYTGSWGLNKECTGALNPGPTTLNGNPMMSYQYWNGDSLNIPGVINDKLLEPSDVLIESPEEYNQFTRVTKSNWRIECVDRLNASGTKIGEGYKAHSPDGKTYTFAHRKILPGVPFNPKEGFKYQGYMLVTKVEDRFNNFVNYTYDTQSRLTKIQANDGREITLEYTDPDNNTLITQIKANGKTWQYGYVGSQWDKTLSKVTLPDGRFWQYSLYNLGKEKLLSSNNDRCLFSGPREAEVTGSITHPDGVVGQYHVKETLHGRTQVTRLRSTPGQLIIPKCFANFSLVKKTLNGPQINEMQWLYSYSSNKGTFSDETAGVAEKLNITNLPAGVDAVNYKTTTVTSPDGSKMRYYYNRDWSSVFDGLNIATEYFDTNGSTLLQTVINEYQQGEHVGYPKMNNENTLPFRYRANLAKRTIIDNVHNDKYYTTNTQFNKYGAVEKWQESNTLSAARYLQVDYLQDHGNWILNLPTLRKASSDNINWVTYKETSYYTSGSKKSLPYQSKIMGRWISQNTDYHADGNVKRIDYNGSNRYEIYENYKRGKAQKITLPCSKNSACSTANGSTSNTTIALLEINDDGTTKSTTDFKGNKTNYQYNAVGWLTKVDPVDTQWADTTISYQTVTTADDGISGSGVKVGQMKQTITRGDFEKRNYHDGLFRLVFSRELDKTNTATTRYHRAAYDFQNRKTFASFPSSSLTADKGMQTVYDALGRTTSVTRNTDNATTSYSYLAQNKVRVTDAENNQTTTKYQAFGAPSQSRATLIESPENVSTSMSYNLFGQIETITQGGITEKRFYDGYYQLCKKVRPETGNTAYGYNAQRQMVWGAENASGSSTTCDASSVLASEKTQMSYDNLDVIALENYPDSAPDKVYTYDENGALTQLATGANVWNYAYDSAGNLDFEQLTVDGKNFLLDYSYNALGNLTQVKYPSQRIVAFAPNALGQPTQAGTYASAATYHPNGQVKQLTFGNGLIHSMSLDTSQRPDAVMVKKGSSQLLHQDYGYDYNDNVNAIDDYINRSNDIDLSFDGLNRLVSAKGAWGTGYLAYDDLGNIKRKVLGSQDLTYHYNTKNQLSRLSGSVNRDFQYDPRGNVKHNGQYGLSFNRANQLTQANGNSYLYDGHSRLIKKTASGKITYSLYSQAGQLYYREVDGQKNDYIYLGQTLVAKDNTAVGGNTNIPPTQAPTLNGDINCAFGRCTFNLNWQYPNPDEITYYELMREAEDGCPPILCGPGSGSGNKIWKKAYSGSNQYYSYRPRTSERTGKFKVRACNTKGCGPYSAVKTLSDEF